MPELTFDTDDYRKMASLQKALTEVLNRANREDKPEAAVAAFALVRLAQQLLDNYSPVRRQELVKVIGAFLERAPVTVEGAGRLIRLH
jgi:hypothetical protein